MGVADLAAVITRARALKRGRAQDDRRLALEVLDRMRTLPAWLIAQRPAPDADALLEHLRVPALLRPSEGGEPLWGGCLLLEHNRRCYQLPGRPDDLPLRGVLQPTTPA